MNKNCNCKRISNQKFLCVLALVIGLRATSSGHPVWQDNGSDGYVGTLARYDCLDGWTTENCNRFISTATPTKDDDFISEKLQGRDVLLNVDRGDQMTFKSDTIYATDQKIRKKPSNDNGKREAQKENLKAVISKEILMIPGLHQYNYSDYDPKIQKRRQVLYRSRNSQNKKKYISKFTNNHEMRKPRRRRNTDANAKFSQGNETKVDLTETETGHEDLATSNVLTCCVTDIRQETLTEDATMNFSNIVTDDNNLLSNDGRHTSKVTDTAVNNNFHLTKTQVSRFIPSLTNTDNDTIISSEKESAISGNISMNDESTTDLPDVTSPGKESNISNKTSPGKDKAYDATGDISTEVANDIVFYSRCAVCPAVSFIGLMGNIASCAIMVRSGLGKSSNILLLGLAVADMAAVMSGLNIPYILYVYSLEDRFLSYAWEYSYEVSRFCFTMFQINRALSLTGRYCSPSITMVITIERIVAVFAPLKFNTIFTPRRASIAVSSVFLLWTPWCISVSLWYKFDYVEYRRNRGGKVGTIQLSEFYINNADIVRGLLNDYVFNYLSGIVPMVIVSLGCVLIGIRVWISLRKRQRMVSESAAKRTSSSRTTRTLLVVCIVFVVCIGVSVIFSILLDQEKATYYENLYRVLGEIEIFMAILNSSVNFFIYVLFNNKFRKIFYDMVRCRKSSVTRH